MIKPTPIMLATPVGGDVVASVLVREATCADAPGLASLHAAASREPDGNFIHLPGELPDLARVEASIAAADASPRRLLLVAESDGRIIGRLALRGERRARLAHRGEFSILVARERRGTGIGTAMIRVMLAWVAAHPTLCKVSLNVAASNARARRLYESLGFVVEGVRDRGIHLRNGRYVDDVMMSLWIEKSAIS